MNSIETVVGKMQEDECFVSYLFVVCFETALDQKSKEEPSYLGVYLFVEFIIK